MEEIWKDIPNYEGYYQASNLGRIKSLKRMVKGKNSLRVQNERILKQFFDFHGYCVVSLYKDKYKRFKTHQLVAMAFLNHKPCGHKLVVNHINFDKKDNRLENLEIVTQRENANLKRFKSSSEYVGVNWYKRSNKWVAKIWVNGKKKHLGYFINEYDAHLAYQKALNEL